MTRFPASKPGVETWLSVTLRWNKMRRYSGVLEVEGDGDVRLLKQPCKTFER